MLRRSLLVAGITAAAAGCSRSKTDDTGPPVSVTLLTAYAVRGRDAYAYVALEKGYFRAAGFNVTIEPGGDPATNLRRLTGDRPVFAAVDLTSVLLVAAGAGSPKGQSGFGLLAGIHQMTTAAILAPGGGSIGAPPDLAGKTLAGAAGSAVRELFPTYARLAGIDAARTRWVDSTPQAVSGDLSGGRVAGVGDTVAGRRSFEAATHRRTPVARLQRSAPGFVWGCFGDFYGVRASASGQGPEVRRRAAPGLADAIDDPAAAGAIMHKAVPGVTAEAAAAELVLIAPYVRSSVEGPAEGLPVGALDANRVARSIAVLQGTGRIGPGLTPDQMII
jgi:NitT/TauT family transport system substrate-binding protein